MFGSFRKGMVKEGSVGTGSGADDESLRIATPKRGNSDHESTSSTAAISPDGDEAILRILKSQLTPQSPKP